MSQEYIWETFDSLFKTVHRQGKRIEELETKLAQLEQRLNEGEATKPANQQES
jgi:BMFP domain-containing protein YqiC